MYRSDLAEESLLAKLLEVLLLHLEHIAPAVEDIVVVAILQVADFVQEAGDRQWHLLLVRHSPQPFTDVHYHLLAGLGQRFEAAAAARVGVLLELAEVRQQRVVVVRQGFRVRHQQRWWWVGLYAQVLEFCDSLEFRCAAARFQPTGFVGGLVFGGEFGIQFGIVFDIILRIEFVIVLRHRLIPKVVTILFLFPKTLTLTLRLLWFGEGTHTGKHQLLIKLTILQPIGKLIFGVRQVNPIINQIFELYLRFADDFERFLEIVDCHLNLLDPRCEVLELIESHDRAIDHLLEGVSLLDEQAHITIALAHLLLEHLGPALNLIPIDRVIVLNLLAFFLEACLELIHIPIDPVLHPRLI